MNDLWEKDNNATPKKEKKGTAKKDIDPNDLNNKEFKSKSKGKEKPLNSSVKKTRIKRNNRSAEKRPIKKNLNKLINDNDEPVLICCDCGRKDKNLNNYCENCKGPICTKCKNPHLINNPNHKYNLNKLKNLENIPKNKNSNLANKNKDETVPKNLYSDVCSKCNKPLDDELACVCNNCGGGALCKDCIRNHNINYPDHDIYNKNEN